MEDVARLVPVVAREQVTQKLLTLVLLCVEIFSVCLKRKGHADEVTLAEPLDTSRCQRPLVEEKNPAEVTLAEPLELCRCRGQVGVRNLIKAHQVDVWIG